MDTDSSYYLRDHLGSNRMVVSGDGTVEQTNICSQRYYLTT